MTKDYTVKCKGNLEEYSEKLAQRWFATSNRNCELTRKLEEEKGGYAEIPAHLSKEEEVAMYEFLSHEALGLKGILLKLKVACDFEDFYGKAIQETYVAPKAIISAINDLELLLMRSAIYDENEEEEVVLSKPKLRAV